MDKSPRKGNDQVGASASIAMPPKPVAIKTQVIGTISRFDSLRAAFRFGYRFLLCLTGAILTKVSEAPLRSQSIGHDGAIEHSVNQYHRPRPYQPNPPNRNITTTMIKSVFVSMVVLSKIFAAPCDGIRMSTATGGDIAAALRLHQDRKILHLPLLEAPVSAAYSSSGRSQNSRNGASDLWALLIIRGYATAAW